MEACKHEITNRLFPLSRGDLDRAHFVARQPNLQRYL
jgi:hypothetical protein